MTLEQTVFMLRELYELERAEFVIRQDPEMPAWCRSVLLAIADRLKWSRYLLSQELPAMIAAAEQIFYAELVAEVKCHSLPAPAPESLPFSLITDISDADDSSALEDVPTRPTIH